MKYLYPHPADPTRQISRQRLEQLRHPDRHRARQALTYAVRHGKVPPPTQFRCKDCGVPASQYDHVEGYAREKWLTVDPVCGPCHGSRARGRNGVCVNGHPYSIYGELRRVCAACEQS